MRERKRNIYAENWKADFMARQEEGKLTSEFKFPQGADKALLEKLKERTKQTGSLRTAVADQIEEEGLFLRGLTEKFFPDDQERKIAVDEYTFVGTLILETESALQSGNYEDDKLPRWFNKDIPPPEHDRFLREKKQVELFQKDPSGFSLLTWWGNRALEEFQNFSEEEKRAVLSGRLQGIKRYKELYNALVARDVPSDKAPS